MRIYLEAEEILSEEELLKRQPLSIRVEVKSDREAIDLWNTTFKRFFEGRKYVARIHYHYHEENRPCQIRVIEEAR